MEYLTGIAWHQTCMRSRVTGLLLTFNFWSNCLGHFSAGTDSPSFTCIKIMFWAIKLQLLHLSEKKKIHKSFTNLFSIILRKKMRDFIHNWIVFEHLSHFIFVGICVLSVCACMCVCLSNRKLESCSLVDYISYATLSILSF